MLIVKQSKPKRKINLEDKFLQEWQRQFPDPTLSHVGGVQLPAPSRQYKFHPGRKWLLDFAWPILKVAVEIHGGMHIRGRHNRAYGMEADHEKSNEAQRLGWIVLTFSTSNLSNRAKRQALIRYVATILLERANAQAHQPCPPPTIHCIDGHYCSGCEHCLPNKQHSVIKRASTQRRP